MNFTCKLPLYGIESVCVLNTKWSEQQIDLLLLHDNKAWNGKFQISGNEEMVEFLEQLSMSEEEYLKEAKIALTTHGGAENFAYSIEGEKFIWKKYVRENMSVKFGYINISLLPVFDTFIKIIDNILQSHKEMSDKLCVTLKENQALDEDTGILKTILNQLIDEKSEMETTLYCKFLGVLNEKKKMIKGLKLKLEPTHHLSNDSDSQHSNNDFGSETEIDSEDEIDNRRTVEIVDYRSTLELEERIPFSLPKRSRHTVMEDVPAGPSGVNKLPAQSASKEWSAPVKEPVSSVIRKSKRNGSSVKPVIETEAVNNTEEAAFMFPKRSKSANTCQNNPTVGKVCYDSDDNSTNLDKTIVTSGSGDIISHGNVTKEKDSVKIHHKIDLAEMKEVCKNKTTNPSKELEESEKTCTRFSSSTLNMLNKLL